MDKFHKATIIPRGRALGVTQLVPEEDRMNAGELESREMLDDTEVVEIIGPATPRSVPHRGRLQADCTFDADPVPIGMGIAAPSRLPSLLPRIVVGDHEVVGKTAVRLLDQLDGFERRQFDVAVRDQGGERLGGDELQVGNRERPR